MAIATNAQKTQFFIGNGTATTFSLPVPADYVEAVYVLPGGATAFTVDTYTATSAAASATNVNFNGAPEAPGTQLVFDSAPASGSLIIVPFVPAGTL